MTKVTALSRIVTLALVAAATTAGLAMSTSAPAQADADVAVSCEAAGTTTFSPGVQVVPLPQQISYKGQEKECNDNTPVGVKQAKITADFSDVIVSCEAGGMKTGKGSGTINWKLDDGSESVSRFDMQIDRTVLHTATVSGHIKEGKFKGQGISGEFATDLLSGGVKCSAGAPIGGVKEAPFTGHFSVNN